MGQALSRLGASSQDEGVGFCVGLNRVQDTVWLQKQDVGLECLLEDQRPQREGLAKTSGTVLYDQARILLLRHARHDASCSPRVTVAQELFFLWLVKGTKTVRFLSNRSAVGQNRG